MIIRSKHDKRHPYLAISRKLLRDRRLTSEERDCLIMMLSNVDDWEFSYTGLATQLGIRRETVKARVQSLIEKGYVSVSYPLGENGKPLPFAKGVWEIREEPIRAGFTGTTYPAHTCPISRHEDLGAIEQALLSRHEDLGATKPAQRITEGINKESSRENHQDKDEYRENHPLLQEAEEVDVSHTQSLGNSSLESSSEALASPLPGKSSSPSAVISQKECLYQQFLKKYPKRVYPNDVEATKMAFFEATSLEGSFAEIMAGLDAWCGSTDWQKLDGQYISRPVDFLTTRMWEKVPRTINTEIDPGLLRFISSDVEDYI